MTRVGKRRQTEIAKAKEIERKQKELWLKECLIGDDEPSELL